MKCAGKYKYKKEEIACAKKWGCKNYCFRAKKKRETPVSKTEECEFFRATISTT